MLLTNLLQCGIIRTIMEHVRSKDLGTSANHHGEPTSYTTYITWYSNEELVEMPSEKEQQTQSTTTAQQMGVKAYEAARLVSCVEAQKEAPSMSLEEFKKQLEEARKVEERVKDNVRETKRREQAYARNRRTSRIPGAIIANAAIA